MESTANYRQLKFLIVSVFHSCFHLNIYSIINIDIFFSLNGNIIPNHGYVAINDIGSTDNTALLCITNRPLPNSGNSGGNWYAPDMTRINYDEINGVTRNRGPTIVRLKRTTSTGTPPEGIYLCEIVDAAFTLQLVYIGVYTSGEGIMLFGF